MALVDELRRREKERGAMRGAGKRFFAKHKIDIANAISEGFPVREIYNSLVRHDEKPVIAYRTFCDYVRLYIKDMKY
jgi:hypothetical protein